MNLRNRLRSEDTEQINVIQWARWQQERHPELKLLHHCPNGGSRNKAEAVKLKQMGVVAGIPDLCLPVPKGIYSGLYIELKYDRGTLQESQKEVLRELAKVRNYCAVCYGAEEAIKVIEEYINLWPIDEGEGRKDDRMKNPNLRIYKDGQVKQISRKKNYERI